MVIVVSTSIRRVYYTSGDTRSRVENLPQKDLPRFPNIVEVVNLSTKSYIYVNISYSIILSLRITPSIIFFLFALNNNKPSF